MRRSTTRMLLALPCKADARAFVIVMKGMITPRIAPSDPVSIVPHRDADAVPTMSLDQLRDRFVRNDGLPFADVLTEPRIRHVLDEHGVRYRDRVFDPVTTTWGFLSQVLSDDHSCRDAVARIIAHRAASGLPTCSPNTASYCDARGRLPTAVLSTLARRTAAELQAGAAEEGKWNGRNVFIADGSYLSMPDTPENRATYPQPVVQQPGIGFPMARVAVLLSLATGACHDLAIAPYAGKGTGETTLLRQMYGTLSPGDVVLADALFDNYFLACELRGRGNELVARVQAERVGGGEGGGGGEPDRGGPARRRGHPLASAQQAARDDGGAVPPLPEGVDDASGDRRCPRPGEPRRGVQGRDHDPRRVDRRRADWGPLRAEVVGGSRHTLNQVGDADGRPALQDAGDGPQG